MSVSFQQHSTQLWSLPCWLFGLYLPGWQHWSFDLVCLAVLNLPAHLPLTAWQHSPPQTGLPKHQLLKNKPSSLYFFKSPLSFSQFFCLPVSLSLSLSIYHSQLLSHLLCTPVSKRWMRCLSVKKNCSFVSYHTSQHAVAVCGYHSLLLPVYKTFSTSQICFLFALSVSCKMQ